MNKRQRRYKVTGGGVDMNLVEGKNYSRGESGNE